jgi:FlaG/FlaF family flagellin (archaellin)
VSPLSYLRNSQQNDTFKYSEVESITVIPEVKSVTTRIQITEKKGTSPVIAVVLMIVIAVAISVTIYAWSSGFVSQRSTQEAVSAECLNMEFMRLSGTSLTIFIRSHEPSSVYLDAVYVDGELRAKSLGKKLVGDSVTPVDLTSLVDSKGGDGTFQQGDEVKLVTARGTQIQFKVED